MIEIEGEVIHGQQLGRRLGFPTANMEIGGVQVENGVYRSEVCVDGVCYRAMSNVGVRPSVDGHTRLLETYLFHYAGDLYGRRLKVKLLQKIREERRFGSVEELKSQLRQDYRAIYNL